MKPTTFIFLALGVILTLIGIICVIAILSAPVSMDLRLRDSTTVIGVAPVYMILFGLTFLGISKILFELGIFNKNKKEEK